MVANARRLRKNLTEAEKRIWYYLRRRYIHLAKFRRQAPIGTYIVDFACYDPRIVIELDGGHHALQQTYDSKRDTWLRGEGFEVLRFWNHDVMQNIDGVLETIASTIERVASPLPNPPPQGGRGLSEQEERQ